MEDDCYLRAAPNEVLRLIIDKVSEQPEHDLHPESRTIPMPPYNDLASVALVCRRLNRIATPALYECIRICTEKTTRKETRLSALASCIRLSMTLRSRRDLAAHCRRLVLDLGAIRPTLTASGACPQNTIPPANEFLCRMDRTIRSLVKTQTLIVSSKAKCPCLSIGSTAQLSQALAYFEKLEWIDMVKEIGSSGHSSQLASLFETLDQCVFSPNLHHLEIRGEHSTSRPFDCKPAGSKPWQNFNRGPLRHLHLTNLVLVNLAENPAYVQATVASVEAIENFALKFDYSFRFPEASGDWSLSTVSEILEPHRPHLKSILIGKMKEPGLGTFDASNYPNLETLTLHDEDLEDVDTETCLQLRGPVLRRLHGAE